jgi:hypothetical protein
MKSFLFVLVAGFIPALTGKWETVAQNEIGNYKSWHKENVIAIDKTITPGKNNMSSPGNVSPRALKDFAKRYKNVTGVTWIELKDNFSASFISNGVSNTIYYNAKGKWQGSLRRYHDDNLPFEVRDIIKSKFHDYSIFCVEELEKIDSRGIPTYIIHLEDKNNVKLVRVFERQVETWLEYKKI